MTALVFAAFMIEGAEDKPGTQRIPTKRETDMAYALKSETHGTFIGACAGFAFFSKGDTADQYIACTEPDADGAAALIDSLKEYVADLEAVEVKSGYWRDLRAAGLDIGDMMENELRYRAPAGHA